MHDATALPPAKQAPPAAPPRPAADARRDRIDKIEDSPRPADASRRSGISERGNGERNVITGDRLKALDHLSGVLNNFGKALDLLTYAVINLSADDAEDTGWHEEFGLLFKKIDDVRRYAAGMESALDRKRAEIISELRQLEEANR